MPPELIQSVVEMPDQGIGQIASSTRGNFSLRLVVSGIELSTASLPRQSPAAPRRVKRALIK